MRVLMAMVMVSPLVSRPCPARVSLRVAGGARGGARRRRACRGEGHAESRVAFTGNDLDLTEFVNSQKNGVEDGLYKGSALGIDSDLTTGELRYSETRSLRHLPKNLKPPERFVMKVALHVARTCVLDDGPLILGIWGPKGAGKSLNVELALARMGVEPIIVSAGELEDPTAGVPGERLRQRYRTAARTMLNQGVASALVINDVDAGLGRYRDTDVTVNNQNATASLMALCDDPHCISIGQAWDEVKAGGRLPRVPIIVTANDLSTLFAPLVRDGRMEKWFFQPSRDELVDMLCHALSGENVSRDEVAALVARHKHQPLDFFMAARCRTVDSAVQAWLASVPGGPSQLLRHRAGGAAAAASACADTMALTAAADDLAAEQQNVLEHNLAREYLANWDAASQPVRCAEPRPVSAGEIKASDAVQRAADTALNAVAAAALEEMRVTVAPAAHDDSAEELVDETPPAVEQATAWREVSPDAAKAAVDGGAVLVDLRSAKAFDDERIKGSINVPAFEVQGTSFRDRREVPIDTSAFAVSFAAACPSGVATYVLVTNGDTTAALEKAVAVGGHVPEDVLVLRYDAWSKVFNPSTGKRRQRGHYTSPMTDGKLQGDNPTAYQHWSK